MALTQVSGGGIKDGQISAADLADGAISSAKFDTTALDTTYTLGADGSNHYTFTGEGLTGAVNDPTLYLARGKTYRFVNGNSAGAHPFRIQTTVNGSAGTEYNTGVTNNGGAGGSTIIFEVPHAAPDVLYYQCTSHGSMGGIFYITGALADGTVTTAKLADDAVTADKLANSINTEIAANTAKTTNATHTGEVTGATGLIIADNVVDEANLKVSNSPTNGYFLQAQSGNTGGLTWAQVAQPDLTNLSATNLTSGTIPDARFPATLPTASGANLTNLAASVLTGALPALDGSALTGIASACTRVKYGSNGGYFVPYGTQDVTGTVCDFTNTTANHVYFVMGGFAAQASNSNSYNYRLFADIYGGTNRLGDASYIDHRSTSTTTYGPWISFRTSSNVGGTESFKIQANTPYQNGNSKISNCYIIVMEFLSS